MPNPLGGLETLQKKPALSTEIKFSSTRSALFVFIYFFEAHRGLIVLNKVYFYLPLIQPGRISSPCLFM